MVSKWFVWVIIFKKEVGIMKSKLSVLRTAVACIFSLAMFASSAMAGTIFTADVTIRPIGPGNIQVSANPSKTAQWRGINGGNTAMNQIVNTPNRATWNCQVINASTGTFGFEHTDMYKQIWQAGWFSATRNTQGVQYYRINRAFLGIRFVDKQTGKKISINSGYFGPARRTNSNGLTQCLGHSNGYWYSPVLRNVANPSDYSFYTTINGRWVEVNYGIYNLLQVFDNVTFEYITTSSVAKSMGATNEAEAVEVKLEIQGTPRKLTADEMEELTKMVNITDQVINADVNSSDATLNKQSSEDTSEKANLRKNNKSKKNDRSEPNKEKRSERREPRNRK